MRGREGERDGKMWIVDGRVGKEGGNEGERAKRSLWFKQVRNS